MTVVHQCTHLSQLRIYPPPDVDGDELTYEIEKVVDSALTCNKQGIQYRIRWKGYPSSEDQWIALSKLNNAQEVIKDFHI